MVGDVFRPTLLVGVGGTGISIAEAVYGKAIEGNIGREGKISVLGIDTDENDIRRIKTVERKNLIRLSSPDPIYRIANHFKSEIESWFVDEDRLAAEVRSMTLLDGAMQIRMLTRLALYNAIVRLGIDRTIGNAIRLLGEQDSRDVQTGQLNIMMVGSLAGATGSGSFLPIALLLRDLCRKNKFATSVRGVFLLPDIFVYGGNLPRDQIINLKANGYASLKELNAVNAVVTQRLAEGLQRPFEYDYVPGSKLQQDGLPFDSVTLIDFSDANGGNRGRNLEAYKEMATRAVFMQLFTPIGARVASVTINDARAKMAAAAQGEADLFSGVGVSSIVYPIKDIKEFLTLKFALENLEGDWLRLDQMYQNRVKRYQEERDQGNTSSSPPDQGHSYIEDLNQLALRERNIFFREIYEKENPTIEDEKTFETTEKPQHITFLDALIDHSLTVFWDPVALHSVKNRPVLDEMHLKNPKGPSEIVRREEQILDRDLRLIEDAIRDKPGDIFHNLMANADGAAENEWRPYHLQFYLMRKGPHLVQARYFLHNLRLEIDKRISYLDPVGKRLSLFRAANIFDRDRGPKPAERRYANILNLAREAGNRGFLSILISIITRRPNDFTRKYVDYHGVSRRNLLELAEESVELKILNELSNEVDALLKEITALFLELVGLKAKLEKDVNQLWDQHDLGAGASDGNRFVLADRVCKQDLWETLRDQTTGMRLAEGANKELTGAIYKKYRESRRQRHPGLDHGFANLFSDAVVDKFARKAIEEDFRSAYDHSVLAAIRLEAQLKKQDWLTLLRDVVTIVSGQSEPFLTLPGPEVGQRIMFWAIHPSIKEEMGDDSEFSALFTYNEGEMPLVMPEFSPYELLCMNSRVNLDLRDLNKLHPGDRTSRNVNAMAPGDYYLAYREMVEEIIAAETKDPVHPRAKYFTPHVHRDWHRPGLMPEIFPEQETAVWDNFYKGFIIGQAFDLIQRKQFYGRWKTLFDTTGRVPSGGISREFAEITGDDDWLIFEAFFQRPDLVAATFDFWNHIRDTSPSRDGDINTWFLSIPTIDMLIRDNSRTLFRIISMGIQRTDPDRRDKAVRALVRWFAQLLMDLTHTHRGDLEPVGREDLVDALLTKCQEEVLTTLGQKALRPETLEHLRQLQGQGIADYRTSLRNA